MSRPDFDGLVSWVRAYYVGPSEVAAALSKRDWVVRRVEDRDYQAIEDAIDGKGKRAGRPTEAERLEAIAAAVKALRQRGVKLTGDGGAFEVVAKAFEPLSPSRAQRIYYDLRKNS